MKDLALVEAAEIFRDDCFGLDLAIFAWVHLI